MEFCCLLIFFQKSTFLKYSFRDIIKVLNSLDPDQALCYVVPDLGPNCSKSYQQTTLGDKELMGKLYSAMLET